MATACSVNRPCAKRTQYNTQRKMSLSSQTTTLTKNYWTYDNELKKVQNYEGIYVLDYVYNLSEHEAKE